MRITLFICFMFSFTSIFHKTPRSVRVFWWNDIDGEQINAHGGCVVYEKGTYYWFGEDRTGFVSNGVSCYQSKDLYNWKRRGVVFKNKRRRL